MCSRGSPEKSNAHWTYPRVKDPVEGLSPCHRRYQGHQVEGPCHCAPMEGFCHHHDRDKHLLQTWSFDNFVNETGNNFECKQQICQPLKSKVYLVVTGLNKWLASSFIFSGMLIENGDRNGNYLAASVLLVAKNFKCLNQWSLIQDNLYYP